MVQRVLLIFLLSLGLLMALAWPPSSSNEEERARQYLKDVDMEYKEMQTKLRNFFWDGLGSLAVSQLLELKHFFSKVDGGLRSFSPHHFKDEDLKRQMKNLRNMGTFNLRSTDWTTFEEAIFRLDSLSSNTGLCPYRSQGGVCELAYDPDAREIFTDSEDALELQHFWLEFRNKSGGDGLLYLNNYIAMYNVSVDMNGLQKPSDQYYYSFYDTTNRTVKPTFFLEELDEVIRKLDPLYKEFHAYVRQALWEKYGEDLVKKHGHIPHHLLEQTMMQTWKKNSLLEHPFPNKKLPNLKDSLDDQEYTPLKIVEIADEFYQSLGLPQLPESFWTKYTRMIPEDKAGSDCKAQVFDFTPYVGMRYCPNPTFKKFLQMHSDMAIVQYTAARNQLQIGLNNEPCVGFSKAIGEVGTLSSGTPKHIQSIGLIEDYYNDEELSLNRLFRQAVHTLFSLRAAFVHEKLFVQMLDGMIEPTKYNCEYWKLMDQYMGVEPPVLRNNRNFDVPVSFYEGVNPKKPHTTKIVAELLGYTFYKALCKVCHQYVPGNPFRELQNCDIYGCYEAGDELMKIMELGSKMTWRDTIEPLVGNEGLNATALLEYYEPLRVWLIENNRKNHIRVGWERSNKCSEEDS